jgi:hypothetical protein
MRDHLPGRGIATIRGGARHRGGNEKWQDRVVDITDQKRLIEAREQSIP